MAKAVAICKETQAGSAKGSPNVAVSLSGWVMVGSLPGQYAVYVVTGSASQLTDLQADPNCVGGALITDAGVRWPELDVAIPAALRTKINTYRANNSLGPIPANTTLLQVARFAANNFDYGAYDVFDGN